MFCPKCGAKALENAGFCQKCGAKLMVGERTAKADSNHSPQQSGNVRQEEPKKKKKKKWPVILGVVIGLFLLVMVIAVFWEGEIDYVATVKAQKPFAVSQGLPYTYGEVFEKYIDSVKWEVRESKEEVYVDISGTLKGTDMEAVITIKLIPDSKDSDSVLIRPDAVTVEGIRTSAQEEAVQFLYRMFATYDEGYEDLSMLQASAGTQGTIELSETYTNEEAGISFRYPDTWWTVDSGSSFIPCIIYSADSRAMLQVSYAIEDFYGVLTEDKATVAKKYAEAGGSLVDLIETSLNGTPARIFVTRSEEDEWKGNGELIVKDYWYANGDDMFYVRCSYPISADEDYEAIFNAIMDSYSVLENGQYSDGGNDYFESVLNQYTTAILEGWDWQQLTDANLNELVLYNSDLSKVGYAYLDLDGDDIEELLIGDCEYGTIYDLYKMAEGKFVLVFRGTERSYYSVCTNSVIVNQGSSGASEMYWDYYDLTQGGGLEQFEALLYEGEEDAYYYWDINAVVNGTEPVIVSKEEAFQIMRAYQELSIDFTPLSQRAE